MNISDVAADRDRLLIKSNDLGCELADACDERDAALDKVKLLRGLLLRLQDLLDDKGRLRITPSLDTEIDEALTDAPPPAAKETT